MISNSQQNKRQILKERAKILAQQLRTNSVHEDYLSVVTFQLAEETYALELPYIREVYALNHLTPLPCTPPFVVGIINVRGQIFSVVDLKKLFHLPNQALTDQSKAIILHSNEITFSILANLVLGVEAVPLGAIQPPPPTLTGFQAEYVKGVTNDPLIILDATKILTDEQLIVYEEVSG